MKRTIGIMAVLGAALAIALPGTATASSHCNDVDLVSGRSGVMQATGAYGCAHGTDTDVITPGARTFQVRWHGLDTPAGGSIAYSAFPGGSFNLELCPFGNGGSGQPPCPAGTVRWFLTNVSGEWLWQTDNIQFTGANTLNVTTGGSATVTVCHADPNDPDNVAARTCSTPRTWRQASGM